MFDSHLHIIDPRFPLISNQNYLPPAFTVTDYLQAVAPYELVGGAVVSGSFQGFDQGYLVDALARLGQGFVGVTQLPISVDDQTLFDLNQAGVRAVRFNLKRGGSEELKHLANMAARVHELLAWHIELYVDGKDLMELYPTLITLPKFSIDHLGLSQAGFPTLLKLVEQGGYVKATGFGRVDVAVPDALQQIMAINPAALLFGTDLPSTRAPRPYQDSDYALIADALGESAARQVWTENALRFYRLS